MSGTERDELAIKTLLWIVLPFGSAVWAISQLLSEPTTTLEQLAFVALIGIAAAGLFVSFRTSVKMVENRLNRGAWM